MTTISRAVLASCVLLLAIAPIAGVAQSHDVPPAQGAAFAEAMNLRSIGDHDAALSKFSLLRAAEPNSFTINYEYGRLLAQMKKYREASAALDVAIKLMDRVDTKDLTVYNTKGFVLLMLNDFEQALVFFAKEIDSPRFKSNSDASRMKVHNNAGLAYLQLDRYLDAQKQFEIAKALGSSLAKKNLEIIASILATVGAANENVPGIFAPAVGSVKNPSLATERSNEIASRLGVSSDSLLLFRQGNGIFQITHGANYSYRKAERLVKEAKGKGIEDAFVASTTEWTLESGGFSKKKP